VWNLADRVIYLLYLFPAIGLVVKTAAATPQVCQPCGKANSKPFLQIERLKENFFINSNASPNGLKISILGSAPFIFVIVKSAGDCKASASVAKPNEDQPKRLPHHSVRGAL